MMRVESRGLTSSSLRHRFLKRLLLECVVRKGVVRLRLASGMLSIALIEGCLGTSTEFCTHF
jgi:hypothetical protein